MFGDIRPLAQFIANEMKQGFPSGEDGVTCA